jgi:two-component system LytT family sensor kinase
MSKQKLYWICQFSGWALWMANEWFSSIHEYEAGGHWTIEYVINVGTCILLTHGFRHLLKRWNWIELPLERLLFRVIAGILGMSFIQMAINIPLDARVIEGISFHQPLILFSYIMHWGKPFMAWMAIYYAFNYFQRSRDIQIEKIRIESSAKETEAKVLRAQLNPHFMFNALNSIRALVLEDPERAQKGITQLSSILRSSLLADRRRTISLAEELRTVDDYLALEKIRYEERLEVRKNIYPETLGVQVPPMMLQTLVENAIKHGVSKPVRGGFVSIEARLSGTRLDLRISNTGVLESTDSGGFGLENTAHRLELLFGKEAQFRIFQASKDVVCAEVLIPVGEAAIPAAAPAFTHKV